MDCSDQQLLDFRITSFMRDDRLIVDINCESDRTFNYFDSFYEVAFDVFVTRNTGTREELGLRLRKAPDIVTEFNQDDVHKLLLSESIVKMSMKDQFLIQKNEFTRKYSDSRL